jgi:predicted PurR-regulated permease PerM
MDFPPPTERQARLIWLALTGLAIAVLVALVAALVWGLGRILQILSPVIWPLAVAAVLALLLDPVVDWLEKKGMPRTRAIAAVFALALAIVIGLSGSIVPQVVNETRDLAVRIPAYAMKLQARFEEWLAHPPSLLRKVLERPRPPAPSSTATSNPEALTTSTNTAAAVDTNAPSLLTTALDKESLQTAGSWIAKTLPRVGSWLFGQVGKVASWFGVLAGLGLIPVYAYYFLTEKAGITARWTDYLPVADSEFKKELVFVLNSINNYLIAFFRGQVLVAICDGVLYAVGFLVIGLPYAVLIGAIAILLTMIPFLGAIITCVAGLLIALVTYGDWLHPLLVLAVFAVVQTLEGLVISPKILGDRVGLHPVTIIIAVMVGTTLLGGLLGGILAIPLTAALRVVMFRYVWKRANGTRRIEPIAKSGEGRLHESK